RTILLVRRLSKRSPYFVAVDGVQDVRSPHRRGRRSRRDAGHHRLASGATVDRDEGGGSRARPARGGPTDLRRRHGGLGARRGWAFGALDHELKEAIAHLQALRTRLRQESGVRSNRAKALALRIRAVVPIMYAAPPFIAVARRWQTQLNENSKVLAFTSTFPE